MAAHYLGRPLRARDLHGYLENAQRHHRELMAVPGVADACRWLAAQPTSGAGVLWRQLAWSLADAGWVVALLAQSPAGLFPLPDLPTMRAEMGDRVWLVQAGHAVDGRRSFSAHPLAGTRMLTASSAGELVEQVLDVLAGAQPMPSARE